MPVDDAVDGEVDKVDNRSRAIQLRAQGLSMAKIGQKLGISAQGVWKLLKTAETPALPLAQIDRASRTLAELAESTRAALAETFDRGAIRARRRIMEVEGGNDDHAAKTILETAKLATDGAARIHGWADTNASATAGRISIGLVADLRELKSSQVVDVEPVVEKQEILNDSIGHQKPSYYPQNKSNS